MGLLFFSPACGVHLQREKATFCPSFASFALLACSLRLSLCASLYMQEKRPFLWVALSLWGCGVWFLLLSANIEDCKRVAVSACYCYLVFVCLHSSCRGACDIIKICFIGCVCAACTMVYCYSVFHGLGVLAIKRVFVFLCCLSVFLLLQPVRCFINSCPVGLSPVIVCNCR